MEHQIWYERGDTLAVKYELASQFGLRGVGMWCLNYMDKSMWQYVPNYKKSAKASTTTAKPHSKTTKKHTL